MSGIRRRETERDLNEIDDLHEIRKSFVGEVDLRTKNGRRMLASYATIVQDLGGPDHVTETQREAARRTATLSMVASEIEEKLSNGTCSPEEWERYQNVCKIQLSLLKSLGFKRQQKDVTNPVTLDDYERRMRGA